MAEVQKFDGMKRFGARYGRTNKQDFGKIENEQRKLHKCPYCSKIAVKRIAMGIWNCKKCGAKFTGKAFSVKEIISRKEEVEIVEETAENQEQELKESA